MHASIVGVAGEHLREGRRRVWLAFVFLSVGTVLVVSPSQGVSPERIYLVSANSGGQQGIGSESSASGAFRGGISAEGRYIAFGSFAENLVPMDRNFKPDVFVRDVFGARTIRVSVSSAGIEGNGASGGGTISADGRFVAFESEATNLQTGDMGVAGVVFSRAADPNAIINVFVHDRDTEADGFFDVPGGIRTSLVSIGYDGTPANGNSSFAVVSPDGRFVAFASRASNLVPGDTNGATDTFVRDLVLNTTERVVLSWTGGQPQAGGAPFAWSADGRFLAFNASAGDLVPNDTNGQGDVFVRDLINRTTERVSVSSAGTEGDSYSLGTSMSGDGRYVVFDSGASNLVPEPNPDIGVFLHDRWTGQTTLISGRTPLWAWADGGSISADGGRIVFSTGSGDIYVKERSTGVLTRLDVAHDGGEPNGPSDSPVISANGLYVAFSSKAANLIPDDVNMDMDAFVRGIMRCPNGVPFDGPLSEPLHHDVEPAAGWIGGGGIVRTVTCAAVVPAGL